MAVARDIFQVTGYGTKTGGDSSTASAVVWDSGIYDKVYIYVTVASAFPNYTSRGPDLTVTLYGPGGHPMGNPGNGDPSVTLGTYAIDLTDGAGETHIFDITDSCLGRIAVEAGLGANGSTARAHYGVFVIGKGYDRE